MTRQEIVKEILHRTREGRINEWVQRLSIYADKAGLPLERISWNNSPIVVADTIVSMCENYYGNTLNLEEILND